MISILGSTGNIGKQTLEVARSLGLRVAALAADRDYKTLESQAREFRPKMAVLRDKQAANTLKTALADTDIKVYSGDEGIFAAATDESAETVLSAVSGFAGLKPALAAIDAGKRLALANKETLVAAGTLVMERVRKSGSELIPVDSEHSAIFQCIQGGVKPEKLLITASGGPFRGMSLDDLKTVTVEDALRHPNWAMGPKITVDSATLMNKGLEVIEAMHLFDMPLNKITVLVHPQSIIHSMVEFADSSVLAQLGLPDMRTPIQYALTYPERVKGLVSAPDFLSLGCLDFYPPDLEAFGCLKIALEAAGTGGTAPAVLNAANEAAVSAFLDKRVGFTDIYKLVCRTLEGLTFREIHCLEDVIEADSEARRFCEECI